MPDAGDETEREMLFVTETSEHIAIWDGEKLTKEQAREQTGIERVEWVEGFDKWMRRLIPQADHVYLATNEHLAAALTVETANDRFIKECQGRYPLHKYERLAPLMHRLRITKDPEEVKFIQKACKHHRGWIPPPSRLHQARCRRVGDRSRTAP